MLYTTFHQQELASPRIFHKGTRHLQQFFIMLKDVFLSGVSCDDEIVGTLPIRLRILWSCPSFICKGLAHQEPFLPHSSQLRHYNSTLVHSNKALTRSPSILLRQLSNDLKILTSFAVFFWSLEQAIDSLASLWQFYFHTYLYPRWTPPEVGSHHQTTLFMPSQRRKYSKDSQVLVTIIIPP